MNFSYIKMTEPNIEFCKCIKKALSQELFTIWVPGEGLEPSHPCGHMPLKHACLPISAPGLYATAKMNLNSKLW